MDIKISRWIGRGLCIVLFLLWGLFFIEHLGFFVTSSGEQPPLWVWLLQIDHGLLLVSYLLCFKFERIGSLGILVTGAILFLSAGAGWYLLLISISPVIFFGYAWIRQNRLNRLTAS